MPHRAERILGLLNNLSRSADGRIAIPSEVGVHYLDPSEVLYMDHTGDAIEISLGSGEKVLLERTMKECEELLRNSGFLRVQRTCIINMARMRGLSHGTVTMDDGRSIAVDPRKLEELERMRTDHH